MRLQQAPAMRLQQALAMRLQQVPAAGLVAPLEGAYAYGEIMT